MIWVFGLLLLLSVPALIVLRMNQVKDRQDFTIFYDAIVRMRDGAPLYRAGILNEHTKPPLATFMLGPLSWIPEPVLRGVLDLSNFLFPLLLLIVFAKKFDGKFSPGQKVFASGLTLLMAAASWYWEAPLGQYNLVCFCALGASLAFANARSECRSRSLFAGAVFSAIVLIKASNLIFLPWFLSKNSRQKTLGAILFSIFWVGAYVVARGFRALVLEHLQWVHALEQITALHLSRNDNMGLATLGGPPFLWLLSGTVLSLFAVRYLERSSADRFLALGLMGWIAIAISPMGWIQNFIVLLPLYYLAALALFDARRGQKLWISCAIALQVLGLGLEPQLIGRRAYESLGAHKFWLWPPLMMICVLASPELLFRRRNDGARLSSAPAETGLLQ